MVSMAASGTNERERASKRQSSLSISPQPSKAVVSARSLPLGTSVVKLLTAELSKASQLLQVLIILTIVYFNVRMSKLPESEQC